VHGIPCGFLFDELNNFKYERYNKSLTMALRESTNLLIDMFEETVNIAFFLTVAMKIINIMPAMGWMYISAAPQKLIKFVLESVI